MDNPAISVVELPGAFSTGILISRFVQKLLRLEWYLDLARRFKFPVIVMTAILAVSLSAVLTAAPARAAVNPAISVIIRSAITGGEAFYWMPTAAMQRIPASLGQEGSVVLKPSSGFTDIIVGARQYENIGVGYEATSFLVNVGSRSMSWRVLPTQVLDIPSAVGRPGTMVLARISLEELGLGAIIEVDYKPTYGVVTDNRTNQSS